MSDINNKISAQNVFDRHGLSLEGALDVLFSEMEKREIRKFFTEYRELGLDKMTANAIDILNAMPADTVATFSVGSDFAIVNDIGAKNGGLLILFKRSSNYYTGGIYFTNNRNDLYIGNTASRGTVFNWTLVGKYVHSLSSYEALTVEGSGYRKLEDLKNVSTKTIFDTQNSQVTVFKGTSCVNVSANIVIESAKDGKKSLCIFKNGEKTPIEISQSVKYGDISTLCIANMAMPVCEDDILDLRVLADTGDILKMKTFTVETI